MNDVIHVEKINARKSVVEFTDEGF